MGAKRPRKRVDSEASGKMIPRGARPSTASAAPLASKDHRLASLRDTCRTGVRAQCCRLRTGRARISRAGPDLRMLSEMGLDDETRGQDRTSRISTHSKPEAAHSVPLNSTPGSCSRRSMLWPKSMSVIRSGHPCAPPSVAGIISLRMNRGVRIHHAEKGGVGAPALPIIGLDVAVNAAAVVEPLYALQHLPARYP